MKIKPKTYEEIDFDSPETTKRALEIMRTKKCLHDIYKETYENMMRLKHKYLVEGKNILEIGSGGGFIKDIYPYIITSDVTNINKVDLVLDAQKLPFEDHSLDAIFAVHVIHHIPDITLFLKEAQRVLKPGGGIVCVEPYWSLVSQFVYIKMHPEPYDMKTDNWKLESTGPMSGANQALSYILLKRDKERFKKEFPNLKLIYDKPFGFIRYMATGGLWLAPKLPLFMFSVLKYFEKIFAFAMPLFGIHHIFVIRKEK